VYDVEKNMITTTPAISTSSMENLPSWSPDGKYLYYISAPAQRGQNDSLKTRYDLLRIPYSYEQNTWGLADTLLRSSDTGLSITFLRYRQTGAL
jgi:Tol biopolymer transport system component